MRRVFLLAGMVALSGTAVFAADPASWGPVYTSGPCKGLYRDECVLTMQYKQKQAEEKAAQQLRYQKGREEEAAHQKAKQEEQEKQQAEWAEARAKERAEQEAREAVFAKQREAEDRAQAAADRKAAVAASALKARCGKDYKAPYIGMALARAQECVTPMKLEGQLNGPNGIISTYRGGGGSLFQSIDGRIIYWHK